MHLPTTQRRPILLLLVAVTVAFVVAACSSGDVGASSTTPDGPSTTVAGGGTSTTAAPPTTGSPPAVGESQVVLVAELVGGCMWMGPNCPTYVLWSDGRSLVVRGAPEVDPFTTRIDDGSIEGVGVIDSALANEVAELIETIEVDAMLAQLGPGRCNACVDGIDIVLRIAAPRGVITIDSVAVDFDESEPFFEAVGRAIDAMGEQLPLEVRSR